MANFLSIQMSQFLPIKSPNLARVRTGYERVIAHRSGMPFSYVAEEDGTVLLIDNKTKIFKAEYKSGKKVAVEFGELYSRYSGESMYVTQSLAINGFKEGQRFKKGDVLIYNTAFFSADPLSKQVDMGLGCFATVAMLDGARTMEDADYITDKLKDALTIYPTLTREVLFSKDTVLHKVTPVGADVLSKDILMIFDEVVLGDEYSDKDDTKAILESLNRAIPKAKYTGKVVKIEVYHRCLISDMSESVAKFVKLVHRENTQKANLAKDTDSKNKFYPGGPVRSDMIGGIRIDDQSVLVRYYIKQEVEANSSDKIVFGAQLKSVSTGVTKHSPVTESGRVIDAVMGASSFYNRMTPSIVFQGILENNMEVIEQNFLKAYFE